MKKIEEVVKMKIAIKMIAPSHGIIWRKDPGKIISSYLAWAKNETRAKAVIVYETMWGATERMAYAILKGLSDGGMSAKLFDISQSDRTEVVKELLDAKAFLLGSSTHDNDMLPAMAGFLEFLKGLRPKNRLAAAFGSYGWSGGAVANIEKEIKDTGIEMAAPSVSARFMPDAKDMENCYNLGKEIAAKISRRR
jgi:flavorubredoxin